MKTLRLLIQGRVQGVFYRESMCREALRLKVGGWVRNCSDGSVEAVVQGEDAAVDALIAWASRGPDRARVERVEVTQGSGSYTVFERLPNA